MIVTSDDSGWVQVGVSTVIAILRPDSSKRLLDCKLCNVGVKHLRDLSEKKFI